MTSPAPDAPPLSVSVVVCTIGRIDTLTMTIESLGRLDGSPPVVVVDQSLGPDEQREVERLVTGIGGRYVRSATRGAGAARNEGWRATSTDIVLFTDDDCEVPTDWVARMVAPFAAEPRVGLVYCNVTVAPFDATVGFIPGYEREGSVTVRTMLQKRHARGIGAGLGARRVMLVDIGGFDDHLGPGAPRFPNCDDGDLSVRALLHGWYIHETDTTAVLHHGFRTYDSGRTSLRTTYYAIGAAYSKPLKRGRLQVLPVLGSEAWIAARKPLGQLVHGHRPQGASQVVYLARGVWAGLRTEIDPATMRFAGPPPARREPAASEPG